MHDAFHQSPWQIWHTAIIFVIKDVKVTMSGQIAHRWYGDMLIHQNLWKLSLTTHKKVSKLHQEFSVFLLFHLFSQRIYRRDLLHAKNCGTCKTSPFSEAHFGTWLPPIILRPVRVTFLISEIIAPPFPNRQPTWLDGTTSRADTGDPFESESNPFTRPVSTDLLNTTIVAFCAGEYSDSTLYETICAKEQNINSCILKPENYGKTETNLPPLQ